MPNPFVWSWSFQRGHDPVLVRPSTPGSSEVWTAWAEVERKLLQLSNAIFNVKIDSSIPRLTVRGAVASESAKREIEQILREFSRKFQRGQSVKFRLEVTAPFRSAQDPDINDPRFGSDRALDAGFGTPDSQTAA